MTYQTYGFDAQCVIGQDHPAQSTVTQYFVDDTGWDVVFVCEAHLQQYIDTAADPYVMTTPAHCVSVFHWLGPWAEVL